jgi:hypothetical protein
MTVVEDPIRSSTFTTFLIRSSTFTTFLIIRGLIFGHPYLQSYLERLSLTHLKLCIGPQEGLSRFQIMIQVTKYNVVYSD